MTYYIQDSLYQHPQVPMARRVVRGGTLPGEALYSINQGIDAQRVQLTLSTMPFMNVQESVVQDRNVL